MSIVYFRILTAMFIAMVFMPGCVEVKTTVKANGKVIKELVIHATHYYETSLKKRLQSVLRDWSIYEKRRGESIEIYAWRKFRANRVREPMPGLRVEYERTMRRLPPIGEYHYKEKFNFADFNKVVKLLEPEKGAMDTITVTVRIIMPGRIIPERTNTKEIKGNVAIWKFEQFGRTVSEQTFEVVARGWRIGLLIFYIVIIIALAIGIYIFYPQLVEFSRDWFDRVRWRAQSIRRRAQRRSMK